MSADPFIEAARFFPTRRLGADPLPLAFGEVASYRRRLWPRLLRAAAELVALLAFFGTLFVAFACIAHH